MKQKRSHMFASKKDTQPPDGPNRMSTKCMPLRTSQILAACKLLFGDALLRPGAGAVVRPSVRPCTPFETYNESSSNSRPNNSGLGQPTHIWNHFIPFPWPEKVCKGSRRTWKRSNWFLEDLKLKQVHWNTKVNPKSQPGFLQVWS